MQAKREAHVALALSALFENKNVGGPTSKVLLDIFTNR